MAGAGIDPVGAVLVTLGPAQAVGLGVEQGVEGVLHGRAHDLAEVLLHEGLVDRDDLAQGLGYWGRGASRDRRSDGIITHVG